MTPDEVEEHDICNVLRNLDGRCKNASKFKDAFGDGELVLLPEMMNNNTLADKLYEKSAAGERDLDHQVDYDDPKWRRSTRHDPSFCDRFAD